MGALKSFSQGDTLVGKRNKEAGLQVMSNETRTNELEKRDTVSEKRRKLLKTAATTAPVIATLQSGAAFANTSAYQCINDAKTNPPPEWTGDPVPSGDNWVRKTITRYKYKKKSDNTISNWWYDVDGNHGVSNPEGPYYRVQNDGTVASRSFDLNLWDEYQSEIVNVIVYYEPNVDYTGVSEVGVYPKYYVAQPYDSNLPINGSCLASMV
ncbi:MAG TPA: hypothetical protein EYP90_09610 [Chromatiaceae bacterium]|nr:hypothetical protein [Chromatiaceae bacterium]